MLTNPNQRIVTVVGAKKSKDGKTYGTILRQAERVAIRFLDDGTAAFLLYVHFALHQDAHTFSFSPAALYRELNISKERCRTAFHRLIDAGFLVPKHDGSPYYTFYELPPCYENLYPDGWTSDEAEPVSTAISMQTDIPPSSDIGMSKPIGAVTEPNRCPDTQVEGYRRATVEDTPVNQDRNITTDNTLNNTNNKTENSMPAIKDTSVEKRHNHSPLDRYSYDKLVYDEAGEPDVERVNALYYIPPEGQGYRMVDDDDMPF